MARRSGGNRQKHENANPLQRMLVDRFHSEIVRLVDLVEPATILDLGCGEGYVLQHLAEAGIGAALTGVDLSSQAVAAARTRMGSLAEIIEGDVNELGPSLGRFDLVMMLEVLEHLEEPDSILDLLGELTDSYVILSVPHEPVFRGLNLLRLKNVRRWGSDSEHLQHWTKRGFEKFVERKFCIVERGSVLPWSLLLVTPQDRSSSAT